MRRNQKLTYRLCTVLLGILAGIGTGVVLIPVAYAERGYFAVGGEWIIVIASAVLTAYAINKFYKWFCQRDLGFTEKWQKVNSKNPGIEVEMECAKK